MPPKTSSEDIKKPGKAQKSSRKESYAYYVDQVLKMNPFLIDIVQRNADEASRLYYKGAFSK
jgi:hypothetical protein